MNELKKNENKNLTLNIMVSAFVRKSLREYFSLSADEIAIYARDGAMSIDDYYLYLKGQREEERAREQRRQNARRSQEFRARAKLKAYQNSITE